MSPASQVISLPYKLSELMLTPVTWKQSRFISPAPSICQHLLDPPDPTNCILFVFYLCSLLSVLALTYLDGLGRIHTSRHISRPNLAYSMQHRRSDQAIPKDHDIPLHPSSRISISYSVFLRSRDGHSNCDSSPRTFIKLG